GVNFALFAENATGVELCLFDQEKGTAQTHTIPMTEQTHNKYHIYLPDIKPGQLYGYRVYGPYDPGPGHRFNPAKLLIDPYAQAIAGIVEWHDAVCGYQIGREDADLPLSTEDSAPLRPKCVVIDDNFDWENDRHPKVPYHLSIIYDAPVKGFTRLHPDIP